MNADKIRNLTDVELKHQQGELADTLFKLKFQLKMGQTESLKKIRDLKKDIARIKTIEREKQVGNGNGSVKVKAKVAAPVAKAPKATKVAKAETAPKVAKAKKAAGKTQTKLAATEKK
jgi:large subunit ribosomal protein L29